MAVTLILSIGLDPDLMVTRSLVLQSAGYLVVSAYSIKEAVGRFQEGDFDLVLLCQSISTIDHDRLTAWIRASGSRIPIVSVSPRLYQDDAFAGVTIGSEPAALLRGIREALINATIPEVRTTMSAHKPETTELPPKKPSIPSTGDRPQMEIATGQLVPLAHTG